MIIVDADAHVMEGEVTWDCLDPAYRRFRPLALPLEEDTYYGRFNAVWLIEGKVYPKMAGRGLYIFATPPTSALARSKTVTIGAQTMADVPARLADMDQLGIDVQVVLPTLFLAALTDDLGLEKALCQAYNRFMGEACAQSNGRIRYVAVLPLRDIAASLEVLREARDLGAVGAFTQGLVWDHDLGDMCFYPLYEELSRLGIPLVVHFGRGSPSLNNVFTEPIPSSFSSAALPVVMAFYSLMATGVYERFPHLKTAFLEAGCGWLPYVVTRLESRYAQGFFPAARRRPSEYLASGNIYVACEEDEDIPYVLKYVGEGQLVAASDYPHTDDSHEEHMVEGFQRRGDLAPALVEKILSLNPLRLYDLDASSLATATAPPRETVGVRGEK